MYCTCHGFRSAQKVDSMLLGKVRERVLGPLRMYEHQFPKGKVRGCSKQADAWCKLYTYSSIVHYSCRYIHPQQQCVGWEALCRLGFSFCAFEIWTVCVTASEVADAFRLKTCQDGSEARVDTFLPWIQMGCSTQALSTLHASLSRIHTA